MDAGKLHSQSPPSGTAAVPGRVSAPAFRGRSRERGATAIEFALVLPVLAMLLLGIIEFGYAFFIQGAVASAARAGVRNYVINYAQPNAQATAITRAKSAAPNPAAIVQATFSGACVAGEQTTLTLTYRYQSLTGVLDGVLGTNITITGKGSMQCGG